MIVNYYTQSAPVTSFNGYIGSRGDLEGKELFFQEDVFGWMGDWCFEGSNRVKIMGLYY